MGGCGATLLRDTGRNTDFRQLVLLLDSDLRERYGTLQSSYDPHNTIEAIETAVIAYIGGQAAACGAFKPYDATTLEIKRMFVRPEYRHHGLAGQILQELESWGQELGFVHAILETGRRQPEAMRLYENHGYKQINNYGQYRDIANSVCFRKVFSPDIRGKKSKPPIAQIARISE